MTSTEALAEIGLIGLGTMGGNLALNIAENGFQIAVFNRTAAKTEQFIAKAGDLSSKLVPSTKLEDFVASIKSPRAIILMVPAGDAVDAQIEALRPLLDAGDLIIDAGNANYHDTNRRAQEAAECGPRFMGIGVSGGEEGARFGPSIMGGGAKDAWDQVGHILESISAKHDDEPCAAFLGEAGAGHLVKTVHNGIEYADMQMIAEVYGVMRDGFGMSAGEIGDVFEKWNDGILQSYLIEISGKVAKTADPETGKPMLDIILDKAGQKGTGRWTAIEALMLGTPASAIEAAVAVRNMSARYEERQKGEAAFGPAPSKLDRNVLAVEALEAALIAGKIVCYAQGFGLILEAARQYDWDMPLPVIAKIWRNGCIIRSSMLNDMAEALEGDATRNLMLAPLFSEKLKETETHLRQVVAHAALHGLPVPALSAALSYFDIMRTERSTANMLQGQRDFFGAHGFERTDKDGSGFHGPWAMG
ncbi:NADP-dependent phosphogluconate dehydrogenase [Roseibium denhamense]|uniref:6-phosphogluconate dehydrogenase, decarboxylating n=1 Tax=Roseibium denhamense TaxID=76305 RepID=A0ABY1NIV1_9HYPH|nr:NADP-dependent phosphogluconate dehydrogenase [Roseibium denhamense]MTI06707.1 NADP-dependent phosphogluconate dehydrogenase [Roseibium denhamense]SMP10438.1 6-phosphogluconate dehydrogenase (decarboxylating) [Roseibium denhamense]